MSGFSNWRTLIHTFTSCNISRKISGIEKKPEEWESICSSIRDADLILWATPVYFQHVPAQYKRFVELLFKRNAVDLFAGKYAAFYQHLCSLL